MNQSAHLAEIHPINGRTYGTLSLSVDGKYWTVKAEPQVTVLAKRLFPGSEGRNSRQGFVRFPNSRRLVGDLNWLMMRYPLEIAPAHQNAWEEAIASARELDRDLIDSAKKMREARSVQPSPTFTGELLPFQSTGMEWMRSYRRTILGDHMGLGKTVQFLAFIASVPAASPALVIVEPHLIEQWRKAINRFIPDAPVRTLRGQKPGDFAAKGITLIHYGLVWHWWEILKTRGFATVCFDEVQNLRRKESNKYTACADIAALTEHVIGLSGTPIYNSGSEIWNVTNVIEMHCLGDWDTFLKEWCIHTHNGIAVSQPEALGRHLREQGLMLRRRKDDEEVALDLPPKHRVLEEITGDDSVFGRMVETIAPLLVKLDAAESAFDEERIKREIANVGRQATGVAKAPGVAAFVAGILEAGESVIVFAHHHSVVDILQKRLKKYNVLSITGRQTAKEKDAAQVAFQSGETKCVIVSMRAAAGLDLFAARCVVFAELDWSPAIHAQGEDRAHRIGQQNDSVLAYYLVWQEGGSSDPFVLSKLGFKVQQFTGIMGDSAETEEDKILSSESARQYVDGIVRTLRSRLSR